MGSFKSLTSKDIIVTPFTVNKTIRIEGPSSLISSSVDILLGVQLPQSIEENPGPSTGQFKATSDDPTIPISSDYIKGVKPLQRVVYSSIRQLYYGNYTSSSIASGSYVNNIQNSISSSQYFPTGSTNTGGDGNARIGVISIPKNLYGDYIKPGTFQFRTPIAFGGVQTTHILTDDKEGNVYATNTSGASGFKVGNIFYNQGIIVLTRPGVIDIQSNNLTDNDYFNALTSSFHGIKTVLQLEASTVLYESQYKCTIDENEFNYSYNPSLLRTSGSNVNVGYNTTGSLKINEDYKSFVTGSDFTPYVSTVGLYNSNQDLLAVGKLAQPLPTSVTTDTTILINIDR